jgi:hypothetical protein
MNATKATPTPAKVIPFPHAPIRDAMPDDLEQLRTHPIVASAYREAERLLEAARCKATQRVAEAYASAFRDLANQRRRTAGPVR